MQLSGCLWFRASHEVLFGLLSHLMARLGWVWQNCSKAHSRIVGNRPMGLPHHTSAASSRTSDPRGSERECPRWKPQSSHNLISKGWPILLLLSIGWNQVNMSSPHPRGGDYTRVEKPPGCLPRRIQWRDGTVYIREQGNDLPACHSGSGDKGAD